MVRGKTPAKNHNAQIRTKQHAPPHAAVDNHEGHLQSGAHHTQEELEELQANEVVVLESILGPDFQTIDADIHSAWHKTGGTPSRNPQNHSFELILRPDTDALKTTVFVKVRFRLPKRYPLLPPIITVLHDGAKGISEAHLKILQDKLTSKAKELVNIGDEMVYELYTEGQDYISLNNDEAAKHNDGPNYSLEEEKQRREQERQEAETRRNREESQKQMQEEQERASKIAQLIREQTDRNSAAREEIERKKGSVAFSENTNANREPGPSQNPASNAIHTNRAPDDGQHSSRRIETFIDPIEQDQTSIHHVVVGPLILKKSLSSIYVVEAAHKEGLTWQMETFEISSQHYSLSNGKRRLEEVEWELDKLRKLRSESLVNVLAAALVTHTDTEHLSVSKQLNIVTDTTQGPSAGILLSHCVELPWARVRFYLLDVLTALEALHTRNILHRDICVENIFLEGSRNGVPGAKVARPGYGRRMAELNAENPLSESNPVLSPTSKVPSHWEAPEVSTIDGDSKHPYTRKRDVWHTGIVAIQMLFGMDILHEYDSPDEFFANAKDLLDPLGAHVVALLKSILDRSTRKRPTASELRSRLEETIRYEDEERGTSSTRSNKQSDIKNDKTPVRRGMIRAHSEQQDEVFRPGSFWQMRQGGIRGGNTSRYENDFEELQLLGKGAYGAVYKARNRLDGRDYAIKKIRLSASAENDEKTLREITALSRLSHQNIVRYVTCWIQVQEDLALFTTTGDTMTSSLQTSTHDFRLPGINDDFMSVGHDAFSHGGSHIHFGNSDSSDEDSDSSDDDTHDGSRPSRPANLQLSRKASLSSSSDSIQASKNEALPSLSTSQLLPSQPRWLFIQMEYVENQTLKEAIDRGISIEDSWRLFRQMIEALAHVATLGIIHRDLKPSNILMFGGTGDSAGNIKLGDFGLATTTPNQAGEGGAVYGTAEESNDQTTDIGTNLYIAPEVLQAGTSRYDSKVDVYAIGIVFFEMLASQRLYKTGMERIGIIRDLRLPEVRFPVGWNEAQFAAQTKLLQRMLSHNPTDRPSPLEILKSDLLPPKMEDEYIAECLRLLSMPDSTYNLQLMDSLFTRTETFEQREARDLTFDTGAIDEGQGSMDNRFISVAAQHLRSLFRLRGAVELEAPLLLPPNELYKDPAHRPVELLDKTGKVVQLPFDLVVPFARMVARGEQQRFKRYTIAPVYRPNLLAGGQPRSVPEVDFDIVAPERTPAAEAEVLGVLDEIVDEIPGLNTSEWVFQISHGGVLDLLLERVPATHRQAAMNAVGLLSNGGKGAIAQGRTQLLQLGLPRSILDEIESANLSDDVEVVHEKLQRLIAIDLQPRLSRAVNELRSVIEAAHQFGVQRRFLFTPLLVSNQAFYRDSVYFVLLRARSKKRDVLASGGRYDALLKRFANPTLVRPPSHAVGVQIALGRIALAIAKSYEANNNALAFGTSRTGSDEDRSFGPFMPRRCDVYVVSTSGTLSLRMEVCRELWAANISADLAYEHMIDESPELLASRCKAEGIHFLVLLRSRGSTVKVKAVLSRTEYELHRWELSGWLVDRLQRLRSAVDAGSAGAGGAGSYSERPMLPTGNASTMPSVSSISMQHAPDVDVILPDRYAYDKRRADKHGMNDTRRGRKQAYLGPMQENAARQISKLLEETSIPQRIPILAVDVGPNSSAFNRLCGAALARTDEGLWKLLMDSIEEREYGRALRQRISEIDGRAWLVSIRSDGAVALV